MRAFLLPLSVVLACAVGEPRDPFSDEDTGGTAATACTPGEQRACACPAGAPDGVQVCDDGGDRFGACAGCPTDGGTTAVPDPATATSPGSDTGPDSDSSDEPETSGSTGDTGEPMDGWPSGPPAAVPPAPPPDLYSIVEQTAVDHPDLLAGSCVEFGGDNEFLFEVVRRLREIDDRWGLNWKRGVVGDLSQDVVDYHWGEGPSDGSTDVYIIDMIVGHCGDDPQPGWLDVTQATIDGGTVGRWTLAGFE
jgi:hypothetical protein